MDIKKCDRCGGVYAPYTPDGVHKEWLRVFAAEEEPARVKFNTIAAAYNPPTGGAYITGYIDLCPACRESFLLWMAGQDAKGGILPDMKRQYKRKQKEGNGNG